MEITLIIVGGLTLMTLVGVVADYFNKKAHRMDHASLKRLEALEQQVGVLEAKLASRDEQVQRLEEGMGFMQRLLDDQSKQG